MRCPEWCDPISRCALCLARGVNHPFVQHSRAVCATTHRGYQIACHSACAQVTLILLNTGPEAQAW